MGCLFRHRQDLIGFRIDAACINIIYGGKRQFLFGERTVHGNLYGIEKHREQGNRKQHADDTEHAAAKQDCKNYPEFGKACFIGHYHGFDNIALDLLENKQEYGINDTLLEIRNYNNKTCGYAADEGTEKGNNVGYGDYARGKKRIGHAHYRHEQEGENTDDGGGEQFTRNELSENIVTVASHLKNIVGAGRLEQSKDKLFYLRCEFALFKQGIDENDHGNEEVEQEINNHDKAVDNAGHRSAEFAADPVEKGIQHGVNIFAYVINKFIFGIKDAVYPIDDLAVIVGGIIYKLIKAFQKFGDDKEQQKQDYQHESNKREGYRQATGEALAGGFLFKFEKLIKPPFQNRGKGAYYVSEDNAHKHRKKHIHYP